MKILLALLLFAIPLAAQDIPFPGPGNFSSPGGTQLARQIKNYANASSTTATMALDSSQLAGSELIAICGEWTGSTITTPAISDSRSDSWTAVSNTTLTTNNFNQQTWMWNATGVTAGANTVTVTFASGHLDCITLEYVSPYSTATFGGSSFTQIADARTPGITPSTTTSQQSTMVGYCFGGNQSGPTFPVTAGYTTELSSTASGSLFVVVDKASVAAGVNTIQCFTPNSVPIHSALVGAR